MVRRGVSVKTLKRMLKKKGLKTTGKKATLTRRAKKAHLMKGGLFGFFEGPKQYKCQPRQQYPGQRPAASYCAEKCEAGEMNLGLC